MDPERASQFNQHATRGAEILRRGKVIDEMVCLAVEHHHFKHKSSSNFSVSLVTEIMAAADEIHHLIKRLGDTEKALDYFAAVSSKKYSATIENAFMALFKPN
jgi:peroxiredoxin